MKKLKARLVARGFEQNEGFINQDTFVPTMIVMDCNEYIKHINVKTAFLNGDLEEIVHMEILQALVTSERDINKVCLLKKGHLMFKTCKLGMVHQDTCFLTDFGMMRSDTDHSLYFYQGDPILIVLIYVDVLLIT